MPLESASMEIRVDDLRGAAIIDLLQLHLRSVALHSPPESIHALDLAALRKPDITFWSVWQHDDLLGCGALKALDARHGEIKSMRTVPRHLRKGVAAALLAHIIDEAKRASLSATQPGNRIDGRICTRASALRRFRLRGLRTVCGLRRRPVQCFHVERPFESIG